jgi:ParB family chromosome partitioning protein
MSNTNRLGRGLGALIPSDPFAPPDDRIPSTEVNIDLVVPNPRQPRMRMDPDALAELTESVRTHGIIQPLLVSTETGEDGSTVYQLIAGERRLRAARAAGLATVPVTVRQTTPQELLELAIIENVQRADLSPLEEAVAYQRLVREFDLTQREVAERVGKSRVAVTNTMRLMDLSEEIRASLAAGEITEGHARALLGTDDPEIRRQVWRRIVEEQLNVRQAERIVREAAQAARPAPAKAANDADQDAVASAVQRSLGTKVTLRRNRKGTGSLTIHFYSNEELEGVLDRLGVNEI